MKKLILLAFITVATITHLQAQQFQVGSNAVNVGIGFGTALSGLGTGRPALSASYEHGLWEAGPGVMDWVPTRDSRDIPTSQKGIPKNGIIPSSASGVLTTTTDSPPFRNSIPTGVSC